MSEPTRDNLLKALGTAYVLTELMVDELMSWVADLQQWKHDYAMTLATALASVQAADLLQRNEGDGVVIILDADSPMGDNPPDTSNDHPNQEPEPEHA